MHATFHDQLEKQKTFMSFYFCLFRKIKNREFQVICYFNFCIKNQKLIILYVAMQTMTRHWMYNANGRSKEFIDSVHYFLRVDEENKRDGFICCSCALCQKEKTLQSQLVTPTGTKSGGQVAHPGAPFSLGCCYQSGLGPRNRD